MQTYRIRDTALSNEDGRPRFRHTLKEAQEQAKRFPEDARPDVRIELGEIATDSKAIHDYLNGNVPADFQPLRTWKLTSRGGLVELNADGTPTGQS